MHKTDTNPKRVGCWGNCDIASQLRRAKDLMELGKTLKETGQCPEALHRFAEAAAAVEHVDAGRASEFYRTVAKEHEKIGEPLLAGIYFEKAAQTKTIASIQRHEPKEELAKISDLYLDALHNFLVANVKTPGISIYGYFKLAEMTQNAWTKAMEFSQDIEATVKRLRAELGSVCGITIRESATLLEIYGALASLGTRRKPE